MATMLQRRRCTSAQWLTATLLSTTVAANQSCDPQRECTEIHDVCSWHALSACLLVIAVLWQVYRHFIKMCLKDVRVAARHVSRDAATQAVISDHKPDSLENTVANAASFAIHFGSIQWKTVIECAVLAFAHTIFWKLARADCGFVLRALRVLACSLVMYFLSVGNKKRVNVFILAFVVAECIPAISIAIAVGWLMAVAVSLVELLLVSETENAQDSVYAIIIYMYLFSPWYMYIWDMIPIQDGSAFMLAWGGGSVHVIDQFGC
jgi:hypothetical protein